MPSFTSREHSIRPDVVAGPRLLPFSLHHVCPACGNTMRPWHTLLQFFFGGADRHMRQVYCPGGKQPTEAGQVMTLMGPAGVEARWLCAGIGEPHLHINCLNCSHQVLSQTRTELQS